MDVFYSVIGPLNSLGLVQSNQTNAAISTKCVWHRHSINLSTNIQSTINIIIELCNDWMLDTWEGLAVIQLVLESTY